MFHVFPRNKLKKIALILLKMFINGTVLIMRMWVRDLSRREIYLEAQNMLFLGIFIKIHMNLTKIPNSSQFHLNVILKGFLEGNILLPEVLQD